MNASNAVRKGQGYFTELHDSAVVSTLLFLNQTGHRQQETNIS